MTRTRSHIRSRTLAPPLLLLVVATVLGLVWAETGGDGRNDSRREATPNPFGITISVGPSLATTLEAAGAIGVTYVRTTAALREDETGRIAIDFPPGKHPEPIMQAGFRVAMNVSYYPPPSTYRRRSDELCRYGGVPVCARIDRLDDAELARAVKPELPPPDLQAYRDQVEVVIRRHRPAVIVVGNEEDLREYYVGTPEEYAAALSAACEVARSLRTPCANGGLTSGASTLLVYQDYADRGETATARDYRARAFPADFRPLSPAEIASRVGRLRRFVSAYRQARVDYVNFHWYFPDPRALAETIDFWERAVGAPAITNELGQFDGGGPDVLTDQMGVVAERGLDIAILFNDLTGRYISLVDPDGSLSPTGMAARRFIRERWGPG